MVIGGTDTTSNAVEFALAEMIKKPQVLNNVQQELESVVGKDNIVEKFHINKFPYLYAVMKEALRLHPTLPLLVPHCPSETCTVGGFFAGERLELSEKFGIVLKKRNPLVAIPIPRLSSPKLYD
ncbi:flavonoid 3 -monooxygenase-like, partial [Olea europaea subsp. europaea]